MPFYTGFAVINGLFRPVCCFVLRNSLSLRQAARKHLNSVLLRTGLGFVAWQAVVFALAWYLHDQLSWGKFFSDILFLIGVLELGIGLMVLIGSPSGVPGGQMATFARSARIGGEGMSEQSLIEILEKRFVVLYLIVSGVITFVAAAIVLIK